MKRTAFLIAGVVCALAAVTAATAGVQALITSAQIKDGTIQSRDIKNGAIARADLSQAAANALRGRSGPAGPAGPAGTQGPQGATGAQGAQGPQGAQGATGDTGAQGAKGDPGDDVHVTGSVATAADLPDTAEAGDAYIAMDTGHLHVFDGDAFVDTGLVQGPKGDQGAKGDQGEKGDQGVQGVPGPAGGLSGYEIVEGAAVEIAGADFGEGFADCPAAKVAVGGGVSFEDAFAAGPADSYPSPTGDGWIVSAWNFSDDPNVMTPYAICANEA
jgi:hypothetical protein